MPTRDKVPTRFLARGAGIGLEYLNPTQASGGTEEHLGPGPDMHVASHPDVTRFLKGVSQVNPSVVHRFPSWDLQLVLDALTKPPFEPM